MSDQIGSEDATGFFKEQASQAWAHYRHCESLRADYLKTFFAGYLAAAGFVVTMFKPDEKGQSISVGILVGVSILLIVVFSFSVIFFFLIVRLNAVLFHYKRIIARSQEHFWKRPSEFMKIWSFKALNLDSREQTFVSNSGAIPYFILLFSGFLIPGHVWIAITLIRKPYQLLWQGCLFLSISIVMAVSLVWFYRKSKSAIPNNAIVFATPHESAKLADQDGH